MFIFVSDFYFLIFLIENENECATFKYNEQNLRCYTWRKLFIPDLF